MNSQELFIKECNILREHDDIKKVNQRENGNTTVACFFLSRFQVISALSIYDSAQFGSAFRWLNLGAPADDSQESKPPQWTFMLAFQVTLCASQKQL